MRKTRSGVRFFGRTYITRGGKNLGSNLGGKSLERLLSAAKPGMKVQAKESEMLKCALNRASTDASAVSSKGDFDATSCVRRPLRHINSVCLKGDLEDRRPLFNTPRFVALERPL